MARFHQYQVHVIERLKYILFFISLINLIVTNMADKMEDQLFEDLLHHYNKVSRPVKNASENITIKFGASLIRIIDVDEKNQVFTTNLWLEMRWTDSKLTWNADDYGGLKKIHLPADLMWTPDIVLYNNAAGDPEITIYNDAVVYYNGTVVWKPPAIYKSFCDINVLWFPYDSQQCEMKFGTWSYTGSFVDMRQLPENKVYFNGLNEHGYPKYKIDIGMDLSYFYVSAEWDLLQLYSERNEKVYPSCCGPEKYVDITFTFLLRRRTLFYTVNLIIPCFLISFLTMFVFYLSDHKITFAISILVTLIVFFLILIDIIPPTSVVIPMFGRYLLFTMILVSLSIMISVITVNYHFRRGSSHTMPYITRRVFLEILPKILFMKMPTFDEEDENANAVFRTELTTYCTEVPPPRFRKEIAEYRRSVYADSVSEEQQFYKEQKEMIFNALKRVRFIAEYFKRLEDDDKESDAWVYVGMVIDRLFLIVYMFFNVGTLFIILEAPTLWDKREPLAIPPADAPLGQDTVGRYFD